MCQPHNDGVQQRIKHVLMIMAFARDMKAAAI